MKQWMLNNKKADYQTIANTHQISPLITRLLVNRNIVQPKFIDAFLNPSLKYLHDPFLLMDMDRAVDILVTTIEKGEHIRIIGDYDQDGNSATMTLYDGLLYYHDQISYAIPHRIEEGYGISIDLVEKAFQDQVSLIITCDNGIMAFDAIERAEALGMKVIITDHHQVAMDHVDGGKVQTLPRAHAVINPKRKDCPYPFKDLCGAGVAFKLMQALFMKLKGDMDYLYDLLEYVAMGTVCDIVDLVDENRVFVIEGLKRINRTENYGMQCLIQENKWYKEITAYTLGFILGPCINASGRLSSATRGIELFTEEDMAKVELYAKELVELNQIRKELTEKGFEKICRQVIDQSLYEKHVILAMDKSLHESIVGIVAGRIKDKFHRPTLVLTSAKQNQMLKGSGRSIKPYNMFEKLQESRHLFQTLGGHPMAAGFTIEENRFEELGDFLNSHDGLTGHDLIEKVTVDAFCPIPMVTDQLIEELKIMEPYGKGNPRPLLADRDVNIQKIEFLGNSKNVLRLTLMKNNIRQIGLIFRDVEEKVEQLTEKFGCRGMEELIIGTAKSYPVDVIYYPDFNEFRGEKQIQLILNEIR